MDSLALVNVPVGCALVAIPVVAMSHDIDPAVKAYLKPALSKPTFFCPHLSLDPAQVPLMAPVRHRLPPSQPTL